MKTRILLSLTALMLLMAQFANAQGRYNRHNNGYYNNGNCNNGAYYNNGNNGGYYNNNGGYYNNGNCNNGAYYNNSAYYGNGNCGNNGYYRRRPHYRRVPPPPPPSYCAPAPVVYNRPVYIPRPRVRVNINF